MFHVLRRMRILFLPVLFLTLLAGPARADDSSTPPEANIRLEMTADPNPVTIGDDITFTYTVTNNGDVALHDVTVVDDDFGEVGDTIAQLDPGESKTFTHSQTIRAATNTRRFATASGTTADGTEVHARRDVTIEIVEATTTTIESTTTTKAPTTTTTAAPTTTTTVPTQVLGEQTPPAELPRTGSPVKGWAVAGFVLLISGVVLRRRATRAGC